MVHIFVWVMVWYNHYIGHQEKGNDITIIIIIFLKYTVFIKIQALRVFGNDNYPPNTWCNNNVVIASKRRHFYAITSKWGRIDAITTSLLRNVSAG